MDGAARADMWNRGGEELPGGLWQVHDHAVHRIDPRQGLLAAPLVDNDSIRAVPPHVLTEKLHGDGVRIDCMDGLRLARAGDENCIGADAREHVHDDLPGAYLLCHPPPFGAEAGPEVSVF